MLGSVDGGHGVAKSTDAAPALKVFTVSGISGKGSCHKRSVDRKGLTECQGGGVGVGGREGILGEVSFKVAIWKTRRRGPTGSLREEHPRWTG